MSGTDIAYGAARDECGDCKPLVSSAICLRACLRMMLLACYAMSGTDRAYGATSRVHPQPCEGTSPYGPTALLRGVRY
eukprot:3941923-Rhodomonas_salina.2